MLLEPRKFATIAVFTREALKAKHSERRAVHPRGSLGSRRAWRWTPPCSTTWLPAPRGPAGLRNGVAATAAAAGGGEDGFRPGSHGARQMTLPTSRTTGPSSSSLRLDARASSAAISEGESDLIVVGSSGVAATDMLVIAANGLVSAVDAAPRFEAERRRDDSHGHRSRRLSERTGRRTSWPRRRAIFIQTASVGLRMVLPVAWALRDPDAIAWTTAATWPSET